MSKKNLNFCFLLIEIFIFSVTYNLVISPSEDNHIYVWKKYKNSGIILKNNQFEYFKCFKNENITNSILVPEKCVDDYIAKTFLTSKSFQVISLILNTSDKGNIQVLLNYGINHSYNKD